MVTIVRGMDRRREKPRARRVTRRPPRGALATAAVVAVLAAPGVAHGQDAPRTDPEAGSPAETVYGIPLERARRDAAPNLIPSSVIRSETGVGSSERVPGQRSERPEGRLPPDSRKVQRRRMERRAAAAEASSRIAGSPSPVASGLLLLLVVVTAAGGGVVTGRLVGRRARL